MKQITMDYETYKQELSNAKLQGISYRKDLIESINNLLHILNPYDPNLIRENQGKLIILISKLEEIKD